jgi:hypothetical protein
MRRAALTAAFALLLTGCGSGGGGAVPSGNPDSRHGPAAVDAYASVELLRALLIASSDEYYSGGSAADARTQLQRARGAYDGRAARVRTKDPIIDREVIARFEVLERNLRQGITPDHYRDLAGPLADQLMDGVVQAVVPQSARTDRGVQAEALRRVTTRLAATYAASASGIDTDTARLAFEESWGLWRRALALTALMKPNLGAQKNAIAGALNGLRGTAFPNGPNQVDAPPAAKVDAAGQKVIQALNKRFRLTI